MATWFHNNEHHDPGAPRDIDWTSVAAEAPDGLAVLDAQGRFVTLNRAAVTLCGADAESLIGSPSPFQLTGEGTPRDRDLFDNAATEQTTSWQTPDGPIRELAYRLRPWDTGFTVASFRDVTDERHRQRRVAALARVAATVASQDSLTDILDALAAEVVKTDGLAGVQILTVDDAVHRLQIMGSAGFGRCPDFFERLLQVRERGGTLRMFDSLTTNEPVVVDHRWASMREDPAWAPLRHYLGELRWDSFASVPLLVRNCSVGVFNAFFAPGQDIGARTVEFLVAMAEQAAIAVDYAALVQRERDVARRQERQRLARDLHDSVVQQVFSIRMQAKSLEVLGQRADEISVDSVRRISREVGLLSQSALTDLRAMVHELRPSSAAELGVQEAIRTLVDSTINRTGLRFALSFGRGLDEITGELAEDVYRIVAEAVHNVVKHADAAKVTIRMALRANRLTASIGDDGRGLRRPRSPSDGDGDGGYGIAAMQDRARRWGGALTVRQRGDHGTVVGLRIPLSLGVPLAPGGLGSDAAAVVAPSGPRGRAS